MDILFKHFHFFLFLSFPSMLSSLKRNRLQCWDETWEHIRQMHSCHLSYLYDFCIHELLERDRMLQKSWQNYLSDGDKEEAASNRISYKPSPYEQLFHQTTFPRA